MDCADLQHSCSIALIDYVTNLQIIKLLQSLKSIKIFYTAHPYNQTRNRVRDTATEEISSIYH